MDEVIIKVSSLDEFFDEARSAARRIDAGDFTPSPAAHLGFEDAETLLKALTPNRWTLLRTLRKGGPTSIRALSRLLGRDYRGVHSDVSALLELGLIDRDDKGLIRVPWSKITAELSIEEAV
ncbi:MAG TPA: hypothetical protein ENH55_00305 [Aurantimonas coralicida]|uniref:HTH marR-type domain-containing protein n=1 Tax=marine sediment metagenome TaxID=412755 RepID=A0A0F9W161_9ZZZZ|nr:hypothetical protein [Aurantimonas coralicida]